jgi:hypothetical protein
VVLINCPNLSLTALSRFLMFFHLLEKIKTPLSLLTLLTRSLTDRCSMSRRCSFHYCRNERNLKPFALRLVVVIFIFFKHWRNIGTSKNSNLKLQLRLKTFIIKIHRMYSLKLFELPKNCIKFPQHRVRIFKKFTQFDAAQISLRCFYFI